MSVNQNAESTFKTINTRVGYLLKWFTPRSKHNLFQNRALKLSKGVDVLWCLSAIWFPIVSPDFSSDSSTAKRPTWEFYTQDVKNSITIIHIIITGIIWLPCMTHIQNSSYSVFKIYETESSEDAELIRRNGVKDVLTCLMIKEWKPKLNHCLRPCKELTLFWSKTS